MPRPGPSKYEPLRAYLASLPPDITELTLALAEIEAIIGAPLPAGARAHDFWANHRDAFWSAPQMRAWRAAGWYVAARSLRRLPPSVTFARGVAAGP